MNVEELVDALLVLLGLLGACAHLRRAGQLGLELASSSFARPRLAGDGDRVDAILAQQRLRRRRRRRCAIVAPPSESTSPKRGDAG